MFLIRTWVRQDYSRDRGEGQAELGGTRHAAPQQQANYGIFYRLFSAPKQQLPVQYPA